MKKYMAPVLECVGFKLSECIAICDGSCTTSGYKWADLDGDGKYTDRVYQTVLSYSTGV